MVVLGNSDRTGQVFLEIKQSTGETKESSFAKTHRRTDGKPAENGEHHFQEFT